MARETAPEEGNIVAQLLSAADRHPDHAAIQAIAGILRSSIKMAQNSARDHTFMLDRFRKGLTGRKGYDVMNTIDDVGITGMVREIGSMREVAGIVIAMIAVMDTVGETFDY